MWAFTIPETQYTRAVMVSVGRGAIGGYSLCIVTRAEAVAAAKRYIAGDKRRAA